MHLYIYIHNVFFCCSFFRSVVLFEPSQPVMFTVRLCSPFVPPIIILFSVVVVVAFFFVFNLFSMQKWSNSSKIKTNPNNIIEQIIFTACRVDVLHVPSTISAPGRHQTKNRNATQRHHLHAP